MEWVETTAKTVEAAKEAALDRLGVGADEAEFEILDEPRPGLFGRTRGEGRVRARIKPAQLRPKVDRKRKSSADRARADKRGSTDTIDTTDDADADGPVPASDGASAPAEKTASNGRSRRRSGAARNDRPTDKQEKTMSNEREESTVAPQQVGETAVEFMDGLVAAFGATGSTELRVEDLELDVRVSGDGLGLLVGPGGRTLNAIQDLARVAAQRRLGDHETRLRVDVAGYRERRSAALERFALDVAQSVRETGEARALEPMSSADRKVIHDVLNEEPGVASRSEGDDPYRRIVVIPD